MPRNNDLVEALSFPGETRPGASGKPTDADRAAVQAQALAEFRQERVSDAYQTAGLLRSAIQQANKGADPLLSLLLLPLIGDAAKLENALGQIELALESRE